MGLNARLIVEGRGNWVFSHTIGDAKITTIGRTETNDISLGDMLCSSGHAEIENRAGQYFIRDLGSRNGTILNGKKITEEKLCDGDMIEMGKSSISFIDEPEDTFSKTMVRGEIALTATDAFLPIDDSIAPMLDQLEGLKLDVDNPKHIETIAKLEQELKNAQHDLRIMKIAVDFYRVIAVQANITDKLTTALRFIFDQMPAENGFMMQINPETNKWTVRACHGNIMDWSATAEDKKPPLSLSIVEKTIKTGLPVISESMGEESEFADAKSVLALGIHSCLCFPLFSESKTVGVVYVDSRTIDKTFNEQHEEIFGLLTGQLNAILYPEVT